MVRIDVRYLGGLQCEAVHEPSGETLRTDAPTDNRGRGAYFSPTDLVAAALGACALTLMGFVAEDEAIDLDSARVAVTKEMTSTPRRRIGRITARIQMPAGLDPGQRQRLERAAGTCPVHASLDPGVETVFEFIYPD